MKRNPNDPTQIYDKHKGETILIIGNSKSLDGMDFDEFDCFTTIGINRILRVYEPTYLMLADMSVIKDEHERMKAYEGTILMFPGITGSAGKRYYDGPWVSTGPMAGRVDHCSKTGPIRIPSRGNTAYECAQIAMRMGASRIAFAGVDLYWPPGKDSHFFGSGAKAGCSIGLVDELTEDFSKMKADYATMGIEMVSVSPWKTKLRERLGYIPIEEL